MDDINDIENKLKQGANEPVFEFKDQYWEDALIVLKQAEKDARKKRFFIFLLYLLGGLALISGTATITNKFVNKIINIIRPINNH